MWIKRIILFVGGLFVMSLGVGLSIKSGLGVTPISSIPYSLTLASGVNIGITTVIFNALLVFLQIPILKKRFNPKRLLQLINAFMFGYFTDLSLWILSPMPDLPLDVNFTLLIVSMFLIAIGILITCLQTLHLFQVRELWKLYLWLMINDFPKLKYVLIHQWLYYL